MPSKLTAKTNNIYTSPYRPGDVSIRISYPMDSQEPERVARLSVIDKASGVQLIDVDLPATELLLLMSGSEATGTGAKLPRRPELIGKVAQNCSTDVTYSNVGDEDMDKAAERIVAEYAEQGWMASITRTNYGRRVTARRWLDPADAPAVAE
jgi:hypothetical protein